MLKDGAQMNVTEIQKKKDALRNMMKAQMAELDAQEKKIIKIEKEKAAERLKKNYENNRDSLAAILFRLHAKDYSDFSLLQLKEDVAAILTPPKTEPTPKKVSGPTKEKVGVTEPGVEINCAATEDPVQEEVLTHLSY